MRRRTLLTAAIAAALPGLAAAQADQAQQNRRAPPPPITPENALERAFLAALDDPEERPEFRRLLLESPVVLAMANASPDAAPLELTFGALQLSPIFTSETRMNAVLGPAAPRRRMSGRQALMRLRGKNVVLNMMHTPMLTLEPEDVAEYLGSGQ